MASVKHRRAPRAVVVVGVLVIVGLVGLLWVLRAEPEDSETGPAGDVAAVKAEAPALLGAACRLNSYPFDETVGGIERQQLIEAARSRVTDEVTNVYAAVYRDQAEAQAQSFLDGLSTNFQDVGGRDDCLFEVQEWESVHVEEQAATLTVRGVFAERPHRTSGGPVDPDGLARYRPSTYEVVVLREGGSWLLGSYEDLDPVPPG